MEVLDSIIDIQIASFQRMLKNLSDYIAEIPDDTMSLGEYAKLSKELEQLQKRRLELIKTGNEEQFTCSEAELESFKVNIKRIALENSDSITLVLSQNEKDVLLRMLYYSVKSARILDLEFRHEYNTVYKSIYNKLNHGKNGIAATG